MFFGNFMSKNSNIVSQTVYFSLLVQIITTVISLNGLNYNLNENDNILKDILILENVVQIIEAGYYIWVIFALSNLKTMSSRRYYDWGITTPIMLFTTIIFMEYQKNKKYNIEKRITLTNFIKENSKNVIIIFLANFLMLLFGLMSEIKYMSTNYAVFFGFVFFIISFTVIYQNYAKYTLIGTYLFYFLLVVWGLYAVAALLNDVNKNTMYNCLDIVSKNFYGLFLFYYIYLISKNT